MKISEDLREQFGAAVNARGVTFTPAVSVTHGTELVAAGAFAPRLGTLLWRAKYGADRTAIKPAVLLFARELTPGLKRKIRRVNIPLFVRFAWCVFGEWMDEACATCSGRGQVPIDPRLHRRRGTLEGEPRMMFCPTCKGTCHTPRDDRARIRTLELSPEVYRKHWEPRFPVGLQCLDLFDGSVDFPLRAQLRFGQVDKAKAELVRIKLLDTRRAGW